MSDEAEWITYFPRGKNPVEMPTSGYVEFLKRMKKTDILELVDAK